MRIDNRTRIFYNSGEPIGASPTEPVNGRNYSRTNIKLLRIGSSPISAKIMNELTQVHGFALANQSYEDIVDGYKQLQFGEIWKSDCNAVIFFGTSNDEDEVVTNLANTMKQICPQVMTIYSNLNHTPGSFKRMQRRLHGDSIDIYATAEKSIDELVQEIDNFMRSRNQ